ncbi:MAG: UDP-3-O-(3-hydroxymyristoyl)glucosamine N-acyltransferase [Acidobacteria bacterium]|nr:UDP-3-O-(3-hydroxymyristoyl)glucosamine N-acyltransferase [Acidobacteriota bacterium]
MTHRLADLAAMVGAELVGDPDRLIDGVATLEAAGDRDLSFLTNPKYRERARSSGAGALLIPRDLSPDTLHGLRADLLLCEDAYRALADLMTALFPAPEVEPGVHETAYVDAAAGVDAAARVDAFAVVGAGSTVAAGAVVGAHSVVGRGCRIGEGTVLHPHVVVYDGSRIGDRVIVHSGVVLGADGFGFAEGAAASQVKLPQIGVVVIEDDVEIGANSAVDRATFDTTRVGSGTKIDNLVQVGHNAQIGRGCILCGQAGVSGSSRIGDRVLLAGQAGVAGHFEIGDGVQVAAKSAVFQEVPAGQRVAGIPATPIAAWRRRNALQSRLPAMRAALRGLERRVQELEVAAHSEAAPGADRDTETGDEK